MNQLNKLLSIRRISGDKFEQCKSCSYYSCKFVPSYISENSLVVIGEAPGYIEAQTKVLFTGDSGTLFRKILSEVGFNVDNISFLSVCKCRPTNNEQPDKKAQKLCTKLYLFPELFELQPKLIVLVGSTALNIFFPKESIMSKAGNFLTYNNMTFIPVLHPAYCLRNPMSTPRLRKDLKKAYQYLNGTLSSNKKEFVVVKNEGQLFEAYDELFTKNPEYIVFDVETNETLDVFDPKMRLWTIGLCSEKSKCYSIPLDHPENKNISFKDKCKEVVNDILNSNIKKIAHNASFDIKVLKTQGYKFKNLHADTMVMAHLLDENRYSLGLKQLSSEYLDGCVYEFTKELDRLGLYNCEDISNTLGLFLKFKPEIEKFPKMWKLFTEVLVPAINVIIDMELTGVLIDKQASDKLSKDLNNKLEAIYESISEEFIESKGVNLGSPKQLGELLFNKLKYPVLKKTESGALSTDNDVLEQLSRRKYKLATYLLKVRRYEKLLSTYVEKLPGIVKSDGKVHGHFNICGTATGRLSSNNPNLQNIPRDKSVKGIFVASEGNLLLQADFSQAELRVAASIANEENMIQAYQEGQDIHRLTASRVLNIEPSMVTGEQRQMAKGINFGFVYGATADGFQRLVEHDYNLHLSLDECRDFREKYFKLYPGLVSWYDRTKIFVRKYGYIEYPTGRFRRFPEAKGLKDIPNEVFRRAVNSPVQGSSSDIVLYTMVVLRKLVTKLKLSAKIILTVHDSVVLDCGEDYISDVVNEIDNICSGYIPEQFPWLSVPMKFDYAIGKNWGVLKELK